MFKSGDVEGSKLGTVEVCQPQAATAPCISDGASASWYYLVGHKTCGPSTTEEVRSLIESGAIINATYVFHEGMKDWAKAYTLQEFKAAAGLTEIQQGEPVKWYYREKEKTLGPTTISGIRKLLGSGCITISTQVHREGTEDWVNMSSLREFQEPPLLGKTPPVTATPPSKEQRSTSSWLKRPLVHVILTVMMLGFLVSAILIIVAMHREKIRKAALQEQQISLAKEVNRKVKEAAHLRKLDEDRKAEELNQQRNQQSTPSLDAKSLADNRTKAENGDAQAQERVGLCYETGLGVAEDHAKAVAWYRKAAEQNFAPAQVMLGLSYATGKGVAKDYVEAVKLFRKAAEQDDADAQLALGLGYATGKGVAKDSVQAYKWYLLAAEQGNEQAARQVILLEQVLTPGQIAQGKQSARTIRSKHNDTPYPINTDMRLLQSRGLSARQAGEALTVINHYGFTVDDALEAWDAALEKHMIMRGTQMSVQRLGNMLKVLASYRDLNK